MRCVIAKSCPRWGLKRERFGSSRGMRAHKGMRTVSVTPTEWTSVTERSPRQKCPCVLLLCCYQKPVADRYTTPPHAINLGRGGGGRGGGGRRGSFVKLPLYWAALKNYDSVQGRYSHQLPAWVRYGEEGSGGVGCGVVGVCVWGARQPVLSADMDSMRQRTGTR